MFGEKYELWSSSLRNFLQPPDTFPFLRPNILLKTSFSTPSIYVIPLGWETKFHTHKQQLQTEDRKIKDSELKLDL
jgi:hypothetical protein